ncbi:MAG: glycosyltransferase family 4 protein, partial [Okeania sp. SIO3B3]|nr:glycosyltransferase family 4 protein [Okeania sp. SIO3B3]
ERITLTPDERRQIWAQVMLYHAFKPWAVDKIAGIVQSKLESLAQNCTLIHNARIGRKPLSYASLYLARRLGVPFVFVPYHHPRWVGWRYREYIRLYQQADVLIALTQAEKRTLTRLGVDEKRIFVTGNGPNIAPQADPDRFRIEASIPANVPLILFVGQKYRYKGIAALAEAASIVWQHSPDARFVFIGPQTRFSRRFFATQTDPRLIELGTVDLQQKTDALAACTMLCLPSSQESFGGVFTEAWMFRKPVIGADIPAIAEVIDDESNGYVVAPTAEALATRIRHLLEHPNEAARLGEAGYDKTQRVYSWDILTQKTEAIYKAILG